MLKRLKLGFSKKIKKTFLDLIVLIYGSLWTEGEPHLYEFNKTVITLASSVLVLSFSIIQFTDSNISKSTLGRSWALLVMTLIIGTSLYFMRFITTISYEKVKNKEKYKPITRDNFFDIKEAVVYSFLISLAFILGLAQLILFVIGISLLMTAAFNSL